MSGRYALIACIVLVASCDSSSSPAGDEETKPQHPMSCAAPLTESSSVGNPRPTSGLNKALVHPRYVAASEADVFLTAEDVVFVIRGAGATWVYPRCLMSPHHIVNETIDGRAVMVTYCQLSECATLFSREIGGQETTFDWLMSLHNGSLMMMDALSQSQWVQFVGACVKGPNRGRLLTPIERLERSSWDAVRKLAKVKVLAPLGPINEYRNFMAAMDHEQVGLHMLRRVRKLDERLAPYARGVGVPIRGEACFFALDDIREQRSIQATVGGWSILVTIDSGSESAARVYHRVLDGKILEFDRKGGVLIDRATGSTLDANGRFRDGPFAGKRLRRPRAVFANWFAWSAFFPRTTIWTPDDRPSG